MTQDHAASRPFWRTDALLGSAGGKRIKRMSFLLCAISALWTAVLFSPILPQYSESRDVVLLSDTGWGPRGSLLAGAYFPGLPAAGIIGHRALLHLRRLQGGGSIVLEAEVVSGGFATGRLVLRTAAGDSASLPPVSPVMAQVELGSHSPFADIVQKRDRRE